MISKESTRLVQSSITSISFPSSLERLRVMGSKWLKLIGRDWVTDMDVLVDFPAGKGVTWIAPKWLTSSDILFFYHTKSASLFIRKLSQEADRVIRKGINPSKEFSLSDVCYHDEDKHFKGTIYAPLGEVFIFSNPVFNFGDIIRIGQNTTTPVFGQEFEKLKERIALHNQLPEILIRTKPGNLSFRNVDGMNWPDICCKRETKFVDEAQIRAYLIDHILNEIRDNRSPLLLECDCFRDGLRTGIADYFIRVLGHWIPVEAKLNVLVEENLSDQIEKYNHIQSFQSTKGGYKGQVFNTIDSGICLIIDQSGIFFTRDGNFIDCDLHNPNYRREDINHSSIPNIRESIIALLER